MDFMKNEKEQIHGSEGLKHPSWIAEQPIGQHSFILHDQELESQAKNPLYFEYHARAAPSLPFRLGQRGKFYTSVFKNTHVIMKVINILLRPCR